MCKFIKKQRPTSGSSRRFNRKALSVVNACLLVGSVVGVCVFVLLAIQHTSQSLQLSALEQLVERQSAENNSLSVQIVNTQSTSIRSERLREFGLVDVGALEYAHTQQSAVALR